MSASITVRVPVTIRKRGGRKLVVAPDGTPWARPRARIDNTLIKALARAHRWKRMLDDGRYGSVTALAAGEKLDRGYLGKILMLTLLAPDIVEAIMDGRQPAELGVHVLREGFPMEWGELWAKLAVKTYCRGSVALDSEPVLKVIARPPRELPPPEDATA